MQRIRVRNTQAQQIGASNTPPQQIGLGNAYKIIMGADPYEGEYTVDPDFVGQTLECKGKLMLDDVTVSPIEVQRVSNPFGGRTIYIGGLVNG